MKVNCNFCVTKTRHIFIQILHGIVLSVLFGLAFGFFIKMLWNGLLPDIWGWKEITYWQGVGLVILSRLIFGSQGYHKAPNQAPAECRANFSRERMNLENASITSEKFYEHWWKEEGEASLEKYTKRILETEVTNQVNKK